MHEHRADVDHSIESSDFTEAPADADALLQTFLRHRDVTCPRCDYNLRNLTQPVCPECRETLSQKVDVQPLVVRWLLLTSAPGIFCAIALAIFLFMVLRHGPPGGMPNEMVLTLLFIAASATASLALAAFNRWFIRLHEPTQIATAIVLWFVHIGVFLVITSRM